MIQIGMFTIRESPFDPDKWWIERADTGEGTEFTQEQLEEWFESIM